MNHDHINGRPTQRPLDRNEQKRAFESLQGQYKKVEQPIPVFPVEAMKIEKPVEDLQRKQFRELLAERGLDTIVKQVDTVIEEKKTTETVKQFYCNHVFTPVRASILGMPIRYKICKTCGLVK